MVKLKPYFVHTDMGLKLITIQNYLQLYKSQLSHHHTGDLQ